MTDAWVYCKGRLIAIPTMLPSVLPPAAARSDAEIIKNANVKFVPLPCLISAMSVCRDELS